ncbi:hypothetical protein [uncultured Roseobacter sp.]|uniref:hypothetical protein n=1 Tax=uncultured Roseobacter sp. TaxID=114847 RepID=UPI002603DEA5|nr:hypothetical protein [uncultured Roseobacter sp.]
MAQKADPKESAKANEARADRLKAALKANLARRKAQARARAQDQGAKTGTSAPAGPEKDA